VKNAKETFNFEFSVVSSNPRKIIYDNLKLGAVSNTYCSFKVKVTYINYINSKFSLLCTITKDKIHHYVIQHRKVNSI
jgi:hypothetical protein